jgi:hypothetical protein
MLPLNTVISKNTKVPWRMIEGEAVLVKVDSGEVVHLNEVAAEIWRIIDGKKTISEIADHIHDHFEVNKEQAKKDTLEFIQSILDKNLVMRKGK